jgi:hypothetical protein
MFDDLMGFSELAGRQDHEDVEAIFLSCQELLRTELERSGGRW